MKTWNKPQAKLELFQANEYVAACLTLSCSLPAENGGKAAYDPFRPGDNGNLHRPDHCGAADGFEFILDANGTPVGLSHVKAGSTNNTKPLACQFFTDSSYTVPRDISTIQAGDLIYWTTVNGRTWHHHGTVRSGNHS